MKYFKLLILASLIVAPLCLYGNEQAYKTNLSNPVDIAAKYLEHRKDEKIYIARGDVDIREGSRILYADNVIFNDDTKDVTAEGNVMLQDVDDVVECEKLHINLVTKVGYIEKGKIFIKKGNFTVTGQQINKAGEAHYTIKEGEITTCESERPAWKLSARDVDLTIEGYAKTKSTRFHILDQTVFYLPYGIFPIKAERQTGLLMPSFELSTRDGMAFRESFFWAISKDKDATLSLDWIEKRGIMPGAEFRYALREDMAGTWFGTIIDDDKYGNTRYQIKGRHEQVFFKDLQFKLDGNHVSDINYLEDFGQSPTERRENMIKSTAYFEKPVPKSLITLEAANFKNLTSRDNDSVFKYLPFLSYFTEYIPLWKERFYTDFVASIQNMYREEGENYTRMSFEPRFRMPFSWKGVNFLFNGTAYETAYLISRSQGSDSSNQNRLSAKLEADMNMQFLRNYNTGLFNIGEMQSIVKPMLTYTFIPNTSFRNLPYIDPYDRLHQTNTLTYGLHHYLNTASSDSRELSLFEISQTYGLSGNLNPSTLYDGSGGRFSNIKGKLTLYPSDNISFSNENIINTSGDGMQVMRNTFNLLQPGVYNVNLAHYYTSELSNEMFLDTGAIYKTFEGKFQIRYSFKNVEWVDTSYQIKYSPTCWSVIFSLGQSRRPRETTYKISFDLTGLTSR